MKNVILTTTPTIEGAIIQEYIDIININQVAGTGFLSDLTASFSDIFGGHSGTYRNQMIELYEDVKERMIKTALSMGANAVVGISIDYDSISAKSMSMFMASAHGTAVKLKYEGVSDVQAEIKHSISYIELDNEYKQSYLLKKLSEGSLVDFSEDEWKYIYSHNLPRIIEPLVESFIRYRIKQDEITDPGYYYKPYDDNIIGALSKVDYDRACDILYDEDGIKYTSKVIKKLKLFNAKKILEVAKSGKIANLEDLLQADKVSYDETDLVEINELLSGLDNIPNQGEVKEVEGGLFSKGGERFICTCGTENKITEKFCSECGRDIKGLKKEDYKAIDILKEKVKCLEFLLNKK